MAIGELSFDKVWTDPAQFPTYEGSEDQVRLDLQYHPDAIKGFINTYIIPALNEIIEGSYAPSSVGTAAIIDNNVTKAKLSTVNDEAGAAVDTAQIAAGAITLLKMAQNSVGTDQLVGGAVTLAKMDSNSVDTAQLVGGSVTALKLGTDILPPNVGFVVGTDDPMENPSVLPVGKVYLKLESE